LCHVLNFIVCFCEPVQPIPTPPGAVDAAEQVVKKLAPVVAAATVVLKTPGKPGTAGGERAGKPMTPKGKQEVIEQNKASNDGQTVCENCGKPTTPAQQSKAGVPTDPNQTTVDHIYPANPENGGPKGDGSPSNGRVLCAECNAAKSNTVLTEPVLPEVPIIPD
jgi:HNH endonuclease